MITIKEKGRDKDAFTQQIKRVAKEPGCEREFSIR